MPITIIENKAKLFYKFSFDKTSTTVKIIFAVVFFIFILFDVKWNNVGFSFFFWYIIGFLLFMYLSLERYLEWRKNGRKLISKKNDFLYINNKKIIDLHQVKKIAINYNSSSIGTGWMVFIAFYLHQDVVLKEQLTEKEAHQLATAIAGFFDVEVNKIR